MISYHQMTLADVFTETQELFESDKPEFLKLLESSIDLSELISVTGSDPTVEEYMKKTCGMNRDTGLPQIFLLLKFGCADRINMTYRCRVTCVSICMERERT